MSLSHSCIYGLRATVMLAGKQGDGFTTIRELSDELDIPFHFLTKVLQRLTHSQILESYKGPNGGVKINRNAADITIQDIIKSLDENFTVPECALGLPIFQNPKVCPIHNEWTKLRMKIETMVETITIRELAEMGQKI